MTSIERQAQDDGEMWRGLDQLARVSVPNAVEYAEPVLTGWLAQHAEGADYLTYVQTWGPWALTKVVNHLRSGVWPSTYADSDGFASGPAPELDAESHRFIKHASGQAWLALALAVADLIEQASGRDRNAATFVGRLRVFYANTYDGLGLGNLGGAV